MTWTWWQIAVVVLLVLILLQMGQAFYTMQAIGKLLESIDKKLEQLDRIHRIALAIADKLYERKNQNGVRNE
jgi:hypothetical protein